MVCVTTNASGRTYAKTSIHVYLPLHQAARENGITLSGVLNDALEKELARRGIAVTPISDDPKPQPDSTEKVIIGE